MEKKESASGIGSRGLQTDSLASKTGTSGETKIIDKETPTMIPLMSISRTATSETSFTTLMSKKAEETPPPLPRTRKRSGKESKDVSSGNQKDAVRPVEPVDKKNIKVNERDVESKCDRKDIKSGDKNQVWSKDSKHLKQIEKEIPNQRQEHSNSNKENTRGAENKAQKRDTKEEVEIQKSNRNKFISNPLRRSLKSRKSIKRQGSVKRFQPKPCEDKAVVPENKVEPKKADEEADPLNFIEIRSAAQWKAISQRISWKFDDCAEEASAAAEEEPSGKTRVLPKNRVGAVTLKAPQFDDLPNE